jgi:hypothetical protein
VRDFVYPMFRANALYEGEYLLGTSIARPLIAKRLVEIAIETGADAISHGATGKGNDQVRFELTAYALKPDIQIIAPWREWDLLSREKLLAYAEQHGIPVEMKRDGTKSPYSMDANLLHISYEGYDLEDPWVEPGKPMWRWTLAPEDAPDRPTEIVLGFEKGDCVAIDGQAMSPAAVLAELNRIGGENGIGRDDIVENRFVGMKSRGCYETPGGTILLKAHRAMESLTLDREAAHLKDELMPRYASLVYNGLLVQPRAAHAPGGHRPDPGGGQRRGPAQALQGQCDGGGSPLRDRQPLRRLHRHLRGGCRGLQPGGRHRLHPPQCPAPAGGGAAAGLIWLVGEDIEIAVGPLADVAHPGADGELFLPHDAVAVELEAADLAWNLSAPLKRLPFQPG